MCRGSKWHPQIPYEKPDTFTTEHALMLCVHAGVHVRDWMTYYYL